ncbi:MAG: hypothetical protein ACD_43C00214G0001 [uncultured bacterium]|nr:MAG: hypothetical protein ACD_43C00214G0001 [uncultured bacterium]
MQKKISHINLSVMILSFVVVVGMLPDVVTAKSNTISDAFGVNMHLRQRITDSDWSTALDLANEAGVDWSREEFSWDVIESTNDQFNFASYDSVIEAYNTHDINVLGLLTYSSSWASSNPGSTEAEFYPPDLDAWSDYVSTVAAHYAGQIDYWEIWNEPNYSGFWKGTTDDYVELVETAATAIKTANPNAKIVLGGLSGADTNFLNEVFSSISDKSLIDVVAIHPYRVIDGDYNYAPETVLDGLNSLTTDIYNVKAILNFNGRSDTPIWLTEIGWTTADAGVSNRMQAEYLMRLYTIALAIPDVQKVFWYSFNDTSDDESYADAQFGLVEEDYSKKTAFSAYQYIRNNLEQRWFKDLSLPDYKIIDNFSSSTGMGWKFSGTQCTNGTVNDHDHGAMQISYAFTADTNCYAPVTLNKELPNPTRALQFKVKGDNDNTLLRVRVVDATGETFQYNLGYMPKEWLYYTIQLNQPSSYWNGDKDGKLDQPITFNAFVLDDTDGSNEQGTLAIDEFYATSHADTYLYRFHKDTKDVYAYWTTNQTQSLLLDLVGAGRMREKRFGKSNITKESGDGYYHVQSQRAVKFLQTL